MGHGFAACLLALGFTPAPAAGPKDLRDINLLQLRQAAAWNAHDIDAYSRIFSPNANVVNVLGWRWKGRAELHEKLGRAFASVFSKSRMRINDVETHFLKPDVAVAHVRWTMTGALSPTGSNDDIPQQGIQTQVLFKTAAAWKIVDFQNTNSVPERPFPPLR